MHLTNYSVNKYNVDYEVSTSGVNGENTGSKRSVKFLFEYLRSQNKDATTLWRDIQVKINILRKRKKIYYIFLICFISRVLY